LSRQDTIEDLRFLILVRASILDRKDQGEVGDFNALMEQYNTLIQLKPKFTDKSKKLMEDMEAMKGVFGKPVSVSRGESTDAPISGDVKTVSKKVKHARRNS
jgi:hypothetical protein